MHYTIGIFLEYSPDNEKVYAFMLRTIMILFGFAVMRNQQYYSEEFKENICRFMPFTKEYLLTINNRLSEAANATDNNSEKTKNRLILLFLY